MGESLSTHMTGQSAIGNYRRHHSKPHHRVLVRTHGAVLRRSSNLGGCCTVSASPRYFYISILYNVCYTLALYGLILFWNGASELLQPFNPLLKFVLVKTVVFLTFWQVGCEAASLASAA